MNFVNLGLHALFIVGNDETHGFLFVKKIRTQIGARLAFALYFALVNLESLNSDRRPFIVRGMRQIYHCDID